MIPEIKDFVGVYKNAYDKEFCDRTINFFHHLQEIGVVRTRQQSQNVNKTKKDDSYVFIEEEECYSITAREIVSHFNSVLWGTCYAHYADEFNVLKESASHTSYAVKAQKTKVGGGYHVWHYENGDRANSCRLLTWVLYLNDVTEGGETEFLYYPRRIKAEAGTLVIFPAGFTHAHRGNPPISNEKYILTGWVEF